jgi:hypothetical protein
MGDIVKGWSKVGMSACAGDQGKLSLLATVALGNVTVASPALRAPRASPAPLARTKPQHKGCGKPSGLGHGSASGTVVGMFFFGVSDRIAVQAFFCTPNF